MHVKASTAVVLGLVLGAAGLTMSPAAARAQQPVPMKVTVTVGGKTETLRGTGRCGHEPRAWLHDRSAALWLAEYPHGAQARRVSLSYWRFATGDEVQFSLAVHGKTAAHRISTVKGKAGGFRPRDVPADGARGRFQIAGKAQNGASLQATIECARFGAIAAEGG
jgi:hypothetical protein